MEKVFLLALGTFVLALAACDDSPSTSTDTGSDGSNTTPPEKATFIYTALTNEGQVLPFGGIVYRDYITRQATIGQATEPSSTNFVQLVVTNANYTFVMEAISNTRDFYITMGVPVPVDLYSLGTNTPIPYQYNEGGASAAAVAGRQGIQFPKGMDKEDAKEVLTYVGDDGHNYVVNLIETPVSAQIYNDVNANGIMYDLNWNTYITSDEITGTPSSKMALFYVTTSTDPTPFLNLDIQASAALDATTTTRGLVTNKAFTVDDRATFLPNLSDTAKVPGAKITLALPDDIDETAENVDDFIMTTDGSGGDIGHYENFYEGSYKYSVITNDDSSVVLGGIVRREIVTKTALLVSSGSILETNFLRLVITNAAQTFMLEAISNTHEFYITMGMDTVSATMSATQPLALQFGGATATAPAAAQQGMQFPDGTTSGDAQALFTYTGADNVDYTVTAVEAPKSAVYSGTEKGIIYTLNWNSYNSSAAIGATGNMVSYLTPAATTDPTPFLNADITATTPAVRATTTYGLVFSSGFSVIDRKTVLGANTLSATDSVPGKPITFNLNTSDTGDSILKRVQITN